MMDQVLHLLQEHHLLTHSLHGITFLTLSQPDGFRLAKEVLYHIVDQQTLLFLSGGRTPKEFYSMLASDEKIIPSGVGLIDERYGSPMHETSNEKMIDESGFSRYLSMRDIPLYTILHGKSREEETQLYDEKLRHLFQQSRRSVGILGIGLDGHTAGIPADPSVWKEFDLQEKGRTEYVVDYDDHGKFYNERITMTFLSLSMLDVIIILCFGNDKKPALQKLLSDGDEEQIPSRFYKRPDIAGKTLVITDVTQ